MKLNFAVKVNKKVKSFFSVCLSVILCLSFLLVIPVNFAAEAFEVVDGNNAEIIAEGRCGDDITYKIDSEYTLTFTGSGLMWDSDPYTFWGDNWSKIKKVVIGDGITHIGENMFYCFSSLVEVFISETVTSIGNGAFTGCERLISINLPNGLTEIDAYAFSYCSALESINIPDGVTVIKMYTFYNCHNLKTISLPGNLTEIETMAFVNCNIENLIIPASLKKIDDSVLHIFSLTDITVDKNNEDYSSVDGVLFNKDKTEILIYPAGKTDTSYAIPETVKIIGKNAFEYCENLESIDIPDSVTKISKFAFSGCTGLAEIIVPESVIVIENEAFSHCSELKSFVFPSSVSVINDRTFAFCYNIESVAIPAAVTSIGDDVFSNCGHLEDIFVDENNQHFVSENGILFNKDKTEIIKFPEGKDIEKYAIPDTVTKIRTSAFFSSNIKSIEIPDSVTSIGDSVFAACQNLKSISFPDSVTYMGNEMFVNCQALEYVKLPSSIIAIGEYTFDYCISLTSITVPSSVTYIGNYAFDECFNLESVYIPSTVTKIDSCAFSACESIADVYYEGTPEEWNNIIIMSENDCLENANIHFNSEVPGNSHEHIDGERVFENVIPADCVNEGVHEEVIYCELCGEETFRVLVHLPPAGHSDEDKDYICDVCGEEIEAKGLFASIIKFFYKIIAFFKNLFTF